MIHEAAEWMTCRAIRTGAQAMAAARVEMSVSGLENIPGDGPVLLLARHYHHLFDGVVLRLRSGCGAAGPWSALPLQAACSALVADRLPDASHVLVGVGDEGAR